MNKKRIVTGVLAHVDSGKTTLSEAILYLCGEIRNLGRVDKGNTVFDTNEIEKDRGITIFSKNATFKFNDTCFTLLDTPGHIDFSTEAERAISVLDYGILLISGLDGVQSHTVALWNTLKKYDIPVFIFVNKMDMEAADKDFLLSDIKEKLSPNIIDFSDFDLDSIAMCSEELMDEYLERGNISNDTIAYSVNQRNIFPCMFGSALKAEGISEFLEILDRFTLKKDYPNIFGGRVFKISIDEKSQRVTHLKITGGILKAKELINNEKINEIKVYSGTKAENTQEAYSGMICSVTGLNETYSGQGLGYEDDITALSFEPVFFYKVNILDNTDIVTALKYLKILEAEDPKLNIIWNDALSEISIQLMGEIQSEVLKNIIKERFDMSVSFEKGSIIYKETIKNTVVGVGHYEPLRHYAEVQLLLEPLSSGSGIVVKSDCSEDELEKNWQRLIFTHLEERIHKGVLTDAPLTDVRITLLSGRAHKKHTEGGDFRQATYRAVRQALMQAESVLLEPWYSFKITLPTSSLGRVITDIQNMGGSFNVPETMGENSVIKGKAPVSGLCDYQNEFRSFTHGMGILECSMDGYYPALNQDEAVKNSGYDPLKDADHSPDSVFCSHGAGFLVKWNEVFDYMHTEFKYKEEKNEEKVVTRPRENISATDDELLKIFEMTYGKVKVKSHKHQLDSAKLPPSLKAKYQIKKIDGEYLLVDGYNVLFAWFDLKNATSEELDGARKYLIDRLSNYKMFINSEIIVVFDAYKVKNNPGSTERIDNITVVYTKEAETADHYIEKFARSVGKNYKIRVATSDRLEQLIIFGGGAFRISSDDFLKEIENAEDKMVEMINELNQREQNEYLFRP